MLISKRAADPHANGMVKFFSDLLYMRVKKKKTVFDHHINSK